MRGVRSTIMKTFVSFLLLMIAVMPAAAQAASEEFVFGNSPPDAYTRERGHGFEPISQVICRAGTTKSNGNCTATRPFYFSVALPEGNYLVTVRFGDRQVVSSTVVKA